MQFRISRLDNLKMIEMHTQLVNCKSDPLCILDFLPNEPLIALAIGLDVGECLWRDRQ